MAQALYSSHVAGSGKLADLLVGTTSGVFRVSLPEGRIRPLGLQGHVVNHVFCREPGKALVACPELLPMFKRLDLDSMTRPAHTPGLFQLRFPPDDPFADVEAAKLWSGNAHSCADMDMPDGRRRLLLGTEPADVLHSDDGGATWAGTNSFQALPTRPSWYFPPEPHNPHVLSLDFALDASNGGSGAQQQQGQQGQQGQQQGRRLVVAGIEVGGVVVADADGSLDAWEERTTGLCPDVHSCRADPHHPSRLFAVTGGGGGQPGGLYISTDAGHTWRHVTTGLQKARYTVGLAVSAYREGELLLTSAQRPPHIGTEVYHSMDGGETWRNITLAALGAAAAAVAHPKVGPAPAGAPDSRVVSAAAAAGAIAAAGGHHHTSKEDEHLERLGHFTPVPYFTKQGAVLGLGSGEVMWCGDAGGDEAWHVACRLPERITAIVGEDGISAPSTVMH